GPRRAGRPGGGPWPGPGGRTCRRFRRSRASTPRRLHGTASPRPNPRRFESRRSTPTCGRTTDYPERRLTVMHRRRSGYHGSAEPVCTGSALLSRRAPKHRVKRLPAPPHLVAQAEQHVERFGREAGESRPCCAGQTASGIAAPRIFPSRASVGHTSAGIALPPICFGHIDRRNVLRCVRRVLSLMAPLQELFF